jgi:hypothetical protein
VRKPRRRYQISTRGPKVFRVRWRWAPSTSERTRAYARLAVGGWLAGIGFPVFTFGQAGRAESLYVHGDDELREHGRAIHSFVVHLLEDAEHEGPIRSGLMTAHRRARRGELAEAGLEAIMVGLRRLRAGG